MSTKGDQDEATCDFGLVLLGSTPVQAILIVLAVICPALLVWIYFRPKKERDEGC
jgi:hypothetical protein